MGEPYGDINHRSVWMINYLTVIRGFIMAFWKKKADLTHYAYIPEKERAVIRASICTGEQVSGFRDGRTNEFHEVMLIRDEADRELFMRTVGFEKADKEIMYNEK